MKFIHKRQIQPQYDFPEWDEKLIRGYSFYMDGVYPPFYEIVFRVGQYFIIKKK